MGPGTVRRERRWWEGVRERGSWRWCDLGGQDVGKPRVTPDARKQRYETYDSSLFAVLTSQTLLWARAVVVGVVGLIREREYSIYIVRCNLQAVRYNSCMTVFTPIRILLRASRQSRVDC